MKSEEKEVCKLTRADGSTGYHRVFQDFFRRLDRKDLQDLYEVAKERSKEQSLEGHDLILWGDLRMLFDSKEDDDIWKNQQDCKVLSWKLNERCGVHSLIIDGEPMRVNMLVEKKYPLSKGVLKQMLDLKLEAEEESTMAFELIKFIKSWLEE